MKRNMGIADRVIRIIISLALFDLFFQHNVKGYLGIVAIVIACIFLLTSIVGICPLYSLFGFNTCQAKKQPENL